MKIVLTAPATEMSEYNGNPAIAFGAAFSKPWFIPRWYLVKNFYRPVPRDSGLRVKYAPLGLRRIEAALIESGLVSSSEIGIVHPDYIEEAISSDTLVVGISTKDPLGLGYVSTTYSLMLGLGNPITSHEFASLMKKLRRLRRGYRFRVVLGGAGAWQVYRFGLQKHFGIDVIVDGEGEEVAPLVFKKLMMGDSVEDVVRGTAPDPSKIPCIRGATIYGAVEITRGCGRGCQFCTPTMAKLRSFPLEKILRDIKTNLRHGQERIMLVTEDLYLYGALKPWEPNEDAVKRLLIEIARLKDRGLRYIQVTHLNLAAALYKKELTKWVAEKLLEYTWYRLNGRPVATVEVGIETGSPRLIARYMAGKPKPYTPEQWPSVVVDALCLMEEYDWVALATIIVGLPGEEVEDSIATLEVIDNIEAHGLRTLLVPLLFIPLEHSILRNRPTKTFDELTSVQLEVFTKCWIHNLRIWGSDFFRKYSLRDKLFFKILSPIYMYTIAKKYGWREKIAREIYSEIKKLI